MFKKFYVEKKMFFNQNKSISQIKILILITGNLTINKALFN